MQRCQQLQNFQSCYGIDVQIMELRKWNKKYGNRSIIIVELSPIKISNEFQWQLSADLFYSNFSLTQLVFDLIAIDSLPVTLTGIIAAVGIFYYQGLKK